MSSGIYICWEQVGPKGIERYPMPIEHVEENPKLWPHWSDMVIRELPGGKGDWEFVKSGKVFRADKIMGGR